MSTISDLTFIKTFTGDDNDKIKKYVGLFISAAQPAIEQMQNQLQSEDWKGLKTTSHSLKSQLKYMGITSGSDIAQQIEGWSAEMTDLEKIPQSLLKLSEIVSRACEELEAELVKL
jgi:HPt (histidine-containing phosphotransfer) domain-containing protein